MPLCISRLPGQALSVTGMSGVQSCPLINVLQAYKLQQKNKAVLVDVREEKYFNQQHAAGCVNVGLFQSVQGRTPLDNLKRLAMAGFAMEATGVTSTLCMYRPSASRSSQYAQLGCA